MTYFSIFIKYTKHNKRLKLRTILNAKHVLPAILKNASLKIDVLT